MGALMARHNREITRWADGHLLCSTQDADFMANRFGVDRARMAVIPHAAPDDYLETPALPLRAERLQHLLYVGQFAFVKAPMIVAAAMNAVAEARSEARFTWVAARGDHERIRALLSVAARARIELLDWMPQRALREVYDAAGIFLFPSFFEGTGKASIEALSRGLCVIASDVGGMHDMIESGHSGLLVTPGDASAVSAAALGLMRDPDRARLLSVNAAARAREFTWNRTAQETAAFYRARLEAKR